jgi:hypothetical protein
VPRPQGAGQGRRRGRPVRPRRSPPTAPIAPVLAGVTLQAGLGTPFVLAGALKSIYDLGLYAAFRNVQIARERP